MAWDGCAGWVGVAGGLPLPPPSPGERRQELVGRGTLVFGTTTAMTSAQLITWAQVSGYDDLVKVDGGGSAELNVDGATRVAGTNRDVPVWLGIGC